MAERITLTDMVAGQTGTVVEILGGMGAHNRLRALGIRPGVKVSKVSPSFARGPVVLRVGGTQTALGFGICHKVIMELEQ